MSITTTSEILTFVQGFILGQLSLAVIICIVVKFFIFGDSTSADSLRPSHSKSSASPGLSHKPSKTFQPPPPRSAISTLDILQKTGYDPKSHLPESVDWFNVLISQTLAQIRLDAMHQGVAIQSIESVLNGPIKPSWVSDIKVTEMNLGEAFPIFSNCRITSVDDATATEPFGSLPMPGARPHWSQRSGVIGDATRLQAQIDVELNDVITLAVETKLVLNRPKPFVATLPVALAVSVVRFSGTLLLSLVPVPSTGSAAFNPAGQQQDGSPQEDVNGSPSFTTGSPNSTTLSFTFDPSYTLSLRTSSLVGSRARLTDVPKLAQILESRVRSWFHDRVVYPRFQQVALPSLWPRMKNARGGESKGEDGGEEEEEEKEAEYETAPPLSPLWTAAPPLSPTAPSSQSGAAIPRPPTEGGPSVPADGLRWRSSAAPAS